MKTASVAMQAHLAGNPTTLAYILSVKRRDGMILGFTTHDEDLTYDAGDGDGAITYTARSGSSNTAMSSKSDLSVDNLEVTCLLDSDAITEEDLRAHLFDDATITIRLVNWADLTMGHITLRKGSFGAVKVAGGVGNIELRGLTQKLTTKLGSTYGPICRAELGSGTTQSKIVARPTVLLNGWGANGHVGQYENGIDENHAYFGLDGGTTLPYDNAANAVDSDPTTYASSVVQHTHRYAGCVWSFAAIAGSSNPRTLNVLSGVGTFFGAIANTRSASIWYTLNGGASWQMLYDSAARNPQVDSIPLPAGQDLSLVQVLAFNDSHDDMAHYVGDIFVSEPAIVTAGARVDSKSKWLCNVDLSTYRQEVALSVVVDEFTITINFPSPRLLMVGTGTPTTGAPDGWFDGGVLTFTSGVLAGQSFEVKRFLGGLDQTIKFYLPLEILPSPGDTFSIDPGCNHTIFDCQNKFTNIVNFRGEPFMPGEDKILDYPDAN